MAVTTVTMFDMSASDLESNYYSHCDLFFSYVFLIFKFDLFIY